MEQNIGYPGSDVCHRINPSHIRGRKQTVSVQRDGFAGGKPGYVARHMIFRTGESLVRRVGDYKVFFQPPGLTRPNSALSSPQLPYKLPASILYLYICTVYCCL